MTLVRPRTAVSTESKTSPHTFDIFLESSELIEHWCSVHGRTAVVNLSNIRFLSEFRDIPDVVVTANGGEVLSQSTIEVFDISAKRARAEKMTASQTGEYGSRRWRHITKHLNVTTFSRVRLAKRHQVRTIYYGLMYVLNMSESTMEHRSKRGICIVSAKSRFGSVGRDRNFVRLVRPCLMVRHESISYF
jgi:hypothetical protein